ncbi:MAG: hypothetical protein EHM20_01355, partial [Alphaproteobacteria bacterium]
MVLDKKIALWAYLIYNKFMNTHYLFGYKAELRAKKSLEEQGYLVIRSAGSKSMLDLIAVGHDKVRLIQIKATKEIKPSNF